MTGFRKSDKILLCLNSREKNVVMIATKTFSVLWKKEREKEKKKAHSKIAGSNGIVTNAASPSSCSCFPNHLSSYLLVRNGK